MNFRTNKIICENYCPPKLNGVNKSNKDETFTAGLI
jgi:hypothetical protein